eukprot:CAMPEP_0117650942 /NCGR_PEP_ID=MMETSP0804-20121206/1814_1 /TAXON_ID=1074897 /ORGANISM="Tetraselmis astigmatica, Strain CCMP880" /LENGTH=236 /DNA_ID=CAMNT_0005456859 /DNA_START=208 /DNA_END=919 /DNA_ORIENTATION=-
MTMDFSCAWGASRIAKGEKEAPCSMAEAIYLLSVLVEQTLQSLEEASSQQRVYTRDDALHALRDVVLRLHKRRPPGQKLERKYATGPYIARSSLGRGEPGRAVVRTLAFEKRADQFWGTVVQAPSRQASLVRVDIQRKTKVSQFRDRVLCQENVLQLYIAVTQSQIVNVRNSGQEAPHYQLAGCQVHAPPALQLPSQAAQGAHFHHQDDHVAVFECRPQRYDVRVPVDFAMVPDFS